MKSDNPSQGFYSPFIDGECERCGCPRGDHERLSPGTWTCDGDGCETICRGYRAPHETWADYDRKRGVVHGGDPCACPSPDVPALHADTPEEPRCYCGRHPLGLLPDGQVAALSEVYGHGWDRCSRADTPEEGQ